MKKTSSKLSKKKQNPKLSELAGVDKDLFKGRKPSAELKAMRKEWDKEFRERIQEMGSQKTDKLHRGLESH
jgi:hypothetical protein